VGRELWHKTIPARLGLLGSPARRHVGDELVQSATLGRGRALLLVVSDLATLPLLHTWRLSFWADTCEVPAGVGTPRTQARRGLLADAHFASESSIVFEITM
jgi:hypothetical protein